MLTTAIRAALRRKGLGYLLSPDDSRDHRAEPLGAGTPVLESAMGLDRYILVRDQGATNSCVLHAIDYAVQALCGDGQGPKDKEYTSRSVLAPYYWARALSGLETTDGGCYGRDGLRGYSHNGCPSESTWPLRITHVNRQPGPQSYRLGHGWRGLRYSRIFTTDKPAAVRAALSRRKPVVAGFQIGRSFQSNDGPDEVSDLGSGVGGHMLCLSGYDERGRFRVPNSWGIDWRDYGRCWFTETAVAQARELWVLEGWL